MNGDAGGSLGRSRVDVEEALDAFTGHLREVKGSARGTVEVYVRHVRPFLAMFASSDGFVDLHGLPAAGVRSYVTDLGGRYAAQTLKLIATSLRAFLGFAWMSGWTCCDLRGAVGPVVTHRSGRLPRALAAHEVQRLLSVPDQETMTGGRDYAMLLLMSRLGLRAGEVASLRLEDVDWVAATLTARVKGGDRRAFPIPEDVGQALVAHLRRRPAQTACREVFLQARDPVPMNASAVTRVVARHSARAGLGSVRAHRLRHSAARAVLDGGGTLTEVGELLGHTSTEVTMLYASFDRAALRALVRLWPGEADDA